jgi:tRNASer (uridine44-2'-O)-methyltransferase
MAPFEPEVFALDSEPFLHDLDGHVWTPMFRHACGFNADVFDKVMMNLVKNPNINSSWLFRADIISDVEFDGAEADQQEAEARLNVKHARFRDLVCKRRLIRTLIPRNTRRDNLLDQTCLFYRSEEVDGKTQALVVYLPNVDSELDLPFYHPKVRGIAHMHEHNSVDNSSTVSVHFSFYPGTEIDETKITRTARSLIYVLRKHGEGQAAGYVKRVHHDLLIPQARIQDRYAELKQKYSRDLVKSWAESTDPSKHVFEDLGIASFLIEMWIDMYTDEPFPGFVDIGCGNGLLVHLLNEEGYSGWGFDARARKSWETYCKKDDSQQGLDSLRELLLLPSIVERSEQQDENGDPLVDNEKIHNGLFPKGTFIISNHADELTPWTPILGTLSSSPFIMIPCCSHNLTGARYRAPPPRDKTKASSTYASLVDWVSRIAEDCGWEVETEMLRIPSTRNTALIGRTRTSELPTEAEVRAVVEKYGGTAGFAETVVKLTKAKPRGH